MLSRTLTAFAFFISIIHVNSSLTAEGDVNTLSDEEFYLYHKNKAEDYINANPNRLTGPTKKLYDHITSDEEALISPEIVTSLEQQGANLPLAFSAAITIATVGIYKLPLPIKEQVGRVVTKCAQYNNASIQYALLRTLTCKSHAISSLDAMKIILEHNDITKVDPDSSLLFESLKNFESGQEVLDLLAKKGANVNATKDGSTLYQAILKTFQPDQYNNNYQVHRQSFCKALFDNGYELKQCDVAAITEANPHDTHKYL